MKVINSVDDVSLIERLDRWELLSLLQPRWMLCKSWLWWVRDYVKYLISLTDWDELWFEKESTITHRRNELVSWWVSLVLAELLVRGCTDTNVFTY